MNEIVNRIAMAICGASQHEDWHEMARAAIEAMREPTQAMIDAVYEDCKGRSCIFNHDVGGEDVEAFWRAMISAALERS